MKFGLGLLLCGLLSLDAALADERILSFDADIVIAEDGELTVTETIVVRSEANRIRRGIYRDFPTDYEDRFGNRVRVDYEPLAVLRDGEPEEFFSDRLRNGVRTYFGSANRLLQPGIHRYEYRYRVNRVLGYFDEHDELYWNVTGLDWAFAIEKASARVELDFSGSPSVQQTVAYTGYAGTQGDAYTASTNGATASFATTRILSPHQGLTIAVTWPKGFVAEPSDLRRFIWLLKDNASLLVVVGGLILMLAYLVPVWNRYGRDPEEEIVVTRYLPPDELSPGSLRFVQQMYYDDKTMTSAVISLAVKGYLLIDEFDDEHTLVKTTPENPVDLPETERALYDALFSGGNSLKIAADNQRRLASARSTHRRALRAGYRGRYFRQNSLLSAPALVIGVAATALALSIGPAPTPMVILGISSMLPVYVFFNAIMKRPTVLGQRTIEQIQGFREYLDVAEKDELDLRNPPEKTPELFERYLPYALALGVEQRWAERFSSVLASVPAADGAAYQPGWYSGSWNSFDMGRTTSSVASDLGSAISSSATPPGSTSGVSSGGGFSGGGGSSGGGGGGGGGGGW